jgi:NACalpha-BTF3-like transcription factor
MKKKKRNRKKLRKKKEMTVVKVEETSVNESMDAQSTEEDIELIMNQASCSRERAVTAAVTLRNLLGDSKHIEQVMSQASCSRASAVKALIKNNNDIVNSIMSLADTSKNSNDGESLPPLLSDDDGLDDDDDDGSLPPLMSDEDDSDDNDNDSNKGVIFFDDPNENDLPKDDLITVSLIAGMSDRSMQIHGSTPMCVLFSDYRRLENILPSTTLQFVVGDGGEVSSECDATANDLGLKGGDVIMVVGTERLRLQHTLKAPNRSVPQAAESGISETGTVHAYS